MTHPIPGPNPVSIALLACLGVALAASAQTAPPPGAIPCITNDLPATHGAFLVVHGASHLQTAATNVQPAPEPNAFAWIQLSPPPSLDFTNILVASPATLRAPLSETDPATRTATWSQTFDSEAALLTQFPAGAWNTRLDVSLPGGTPFLGFFRFTLDDRTPPIPRFTNADTVQTPDPASELVLSWDPWTNAGALDHVHIEIRGPDDLPVYSASSGCGAELTLAPGATSAPVPAGRLRPQTRYTAFLTFGASVLASQDRPTLLLLRGARTRTTRLDFRTAGAGGEEVVLSAPRISATGSNLIFTITGIPRTSYAIQSSPDLITWSLERITTLPINGAANISIPLPRERVPAFWRAVPAGSASQPVRLRLVPSTPNRNLYFLNLQGTPGTSYRIESSTNLTLWRPIFPFSVNIPATSTQTTFNLPNQSLQIPAQFYRAVSTPP